MAKLGHSQSWETFEIDSRKSPGPYVKREVHTFDLRNDYEGHSGAGQYVFIITGQVTNTKAASFTSAQTYLQFEMELFTDATGGSPKSTDRFGSSDGLHSFRRESRGLSGDSYPFIWIFQSMDGTFNPSIHELFLFAHFGPPYGNDYALWEVSELSITAWDLTRLGAHRWRNFNGAPSYAASQVRKPVHMDYGDYNALYGRPNFMGFPMTVGAHDFGSGTVASKLSTPFPHTGGTDKWLVYFNAAISPTRTQEAWNGPKSDSGGFYKSNLMVRLDSTAAYGSSMGNYSLAWGGGKPPIDSHFNAMGGHGSLGSVQPSMVKGPKQSYAQWRGGWCIVDVTQSGMDVHQFYRNEHKKPILWNPLFETGIVWGSGIFAVKIDEDDAFAYHQLVGGSAGTAFYGGTSETAPGNAQSGGDQSKYTDLTPPQPLPATAPDMVPITVLFQSKPAMYGLARHGDHYFTEIFHNGRGKANRISNAIPKWLGWGTSPKPSGCDPALGYVSLFQMQSTRYRNSNIVTVRTTKQGWQSDSHTHNASVLCLVQFAMDDDLQLPPIPAEIAGEVIELIPGTSAAGLTALELLPHEPSLALVVEQKLIRKGLLTPLGYEITWPRFLKPRRRYQLSWTMPKANIDELLDGMDGWTGFNSSAKMAFKWVAPLPGEPERAYIVDQNTITVTDRGNNKQTMTLSVIELVYIG